MKSMRLPLLLLLMLTVVTVLLASPSGKRNKEADDAQLEAALRQQTVKMASYYGRDLVKDASWAAKNGLAEDARNIAEQVKGLAPETKGLEKLEARVESASAADEAVVQDLKKTLSSRLEKTKAVHARRLFRFATQCMKLGLFTRAYDLIGEVLSLDPGHKKARKILGYAWDRKEKKWVTQWYATTQKKNFLTREGWIPRKWKKRWDKGERNYNGKWVSEEEERRIRTRNEYNPFRVESEHFEVSTNLGREVAWEYAQLLENFYGQFFRVFIGYYDQIAGAKLLFNRASNKKKHQVYFFPSRKDYLLHVKAEHGNEELLVESAGFYSPGDRLSRFYWSEDVESTLNTMYHEITHQLLEETKKGARGSSEGNNWVIEGAAVYVETWENVDGVWKAGARTDIPELRRAAAELEAQADWDLRAFVQLDNKDFHRLARGLNYALAGAMTHFLMHYDDERYKERFVRFLSDFYSGKVKNDSLIEALPFEGELSPTEKYALLARELREHLAGL